MTQPKSWLQFRRAQLNSDFVFAPASLLLPMHLRRDFQGQAVQADEAGGVHPPQCCYGGRVVLVVGLGRVGFHRGDVYRVIHGACATSTRGTLEVVAMIPDLFVGSWRLCWR